MNIAFELPKAQSHSADSLLYEQLREKILVGELLPGERLPSVKELALVLGEKEVSIAKAYKKLEENDFVETRRGHGTFVVGELPDHAAEDLEELVKRAVKEVVKRGKELGLKEDLLIELVRVEFRGDDA